MIANFHDSVKNHCQKRGKGCASYPEVQPYWGIVFCLDVCQQFLVSPAAAFIFRISTAFLFSDTIVKKLSGNDNRPVTK